MKNLNPYLTFNGNCKEAMTLYHECLGGHLEMNKVDESAMPDTSEEDKNKVMNSILTLDNIIIMASDAMKGNAFNVGTNVSLSIDCSTAEEAEKLFHALGDSGKVTMPMQETFWGTYFGMLTDKFGIHWLFNYDKNS